MATRGGDFNNLTRQAHAMFQSIEQNNGASLSSRGHRPGASKREMEYALVLLLVELATCDDHFADAEFYAIANGLNKLFGTPQEEVSALVARAKTNLASFRSTTDVAVLLRDNLTVDELQSVLAIIDNVIQADGSSCGFEMYHRHKFANLLGLAVRPPKPGSE